MTVVEHARDRIAPPPLDADIADPRMQAAFGARAARKALSFVLWPLLLAACVAGTATGMFYGHGIAGFNVTYLALAVILCLLERVMPHERRWLAHDGQMRADLSHTLFNKGVVQMIIVVTTLTGFGHAMSTTGPHFWPTGWPMAAQVVFALVVMEFGLYWQHRLAHEVRFLWPFHAVHHSAPRLWFFNTGRFHIVDTALSLLFGLPLLLLLGVPNGVLSWAAAITAYIGLLTHCNVEMRCGPLNLIFNTPNLHRWHHSRDLREGNKNYGENITLFDHLFGTYFYSDRQPPADIGIAEPMPRRFLEQLGAPFGMARRGAAIRKPGRSPLGGHS
jgi:sterol desaturase/sphingolipid hydroxylase (fatty acid hydroxylase superfamily)